MPIDPLTGFLRSCARLELDEPAQASCREAAASVSDWSTLPARAEDHGLAPIVRQHSRRCGVEFPREVSAALSVLALRHRDAGRVQTATLIEIVDALDAAGIEHVALKGAVLAHDIYPAPELRPLRDLDILVAPGSGSHAQAVLRDLSFDVPDEPPRRHRHHHLPGATRKREGYQVSVEMHEDAFSYDQPERLTLRTLSGSLREVDFGGRRLRAFGHVDMLRHLTAHLLEPRPETRLLGVVDLVGYAARHAAEIDWKAMKRAHRRVTNALTLMDYITPLPTALEALRPATGVRRPTGVGAGFPLLSTVRFVPGRRVRALREVLYPSEWWMHAYYGVPPGRPLAVTRWTRHLPRLAAWRLRRMVGAQ